MQTVMKAAVLLAVLSAAACDRQRVKETPPTEPVIVERLVPVKPVLDPKLFVVPDDPYPYPLDTVGAVDVGSRVYRHWFMLLRDRLRLIEKEIAREP